MSSKLSYTTIGMDDEWLQRIRAQAKAESRSLGFIIERMARVYFQVKGKREKGVARNAD